MGRGIALLLLQEMALEAFTRNQFSAHLKLIDANEQGFYELKLYLEQQLKRFAEKNINRIRGLFKGRQDIVSNAEAIDTFTQEALRFIDCSKELAHISGAEFIFEAAFEIIPLKMEIVKAVKQYASQAWLFSNTSSIPISLLDSNRAIGFHFYNPPPIQKLMEIIPAEKGEPQLESIAKELAKRLQKTVVISKDVAGFIGNGHFVREMVFAASLVRELGAHYTQEKAVQLVNAVTRDFLLRPMGIFELLDYVGLPIAAQILEIIRNHLPDPEIQAPIISDWVARGLKGGQDLEGLPKEGIFRYRHGRAEAIYSMEKGSYIPLEELNELGKVPLSYSWRQLQKVKNSDLTAYFKELFSDQALGCRLAKRFLSKSYAIEQLLVSTAVAQSLEDVGIVLKNGFHHLYAPHEVMHV